MKEDVVYLIGNPAEHRLTKLGYTDNLRARLVGLQVGSPIVLQVLQAWRGGLAQERALHAYFAGRRHHGEWFDLGDDPVGAVEAAIEHLHVVMEPAALFRSRPRHPRSVFADGDRPEVIELFDGDPFNGPDELAAPRVYLRIS